MNDYGRGQILSAVSVLPVTAAGGLLLFDKANPAIIVGLICVSVLSMAIVIGYIRRYVKNRAA